MAHLLISIAAGLYILSWLAKLWRGYRAAIDYHRAMQMLHPSWPVMQPPRGAALFFRGTFFLILAGGGIGLWIMATH